MDIPMKDVINSYRQQLSDSIHKLTLQQLHIDALEKSLAEKNEAIKSLEDIVHQYEPTYGGPDVDST